LTDEEIRRNYQEYGHPDGKQEYSIGIALPKWIVESSNGYFVLAFYGLLFGGVLPAFVGRWWYGSRNVTKDGIETETAARYFRAVRENMSANDIVDVLSTSHEFETVTNSPNHNVNLTGSISRRMIESIRLILSVLKRNSLKQVSPSQHNTRMFPAQRPRIFHTILFTPT
jgi:translocation protein SEC63